MKSPVSDRARKFEWYIQIQARQGAPVRGMGESVRKWTLRLHSWLYWSQWPVARSQFALSQSLPVWQFPRPLCWHTNIPKSVSLFNIQLRKNHWYLHAICLVVFTWWMKLWRRKAWMLTRSISNVCVYSRINNIGYRNAKKIKRHKRF